MGEKGKEDGTGGGMEEGENHTDTFFLVFEPGRRLDHTQTDTTNNT